MAKYSNTLRKADALLNHKEKIIVKLRQIMTV